MIKNIKVNDPDLLFIILETNPYKILSVNENATIEEINKMYLYLANNHHPANYPHLRGKPEFKNIEFIFQKISDAYNLLKDTEERKRYNNDHQINNKIKPAEWEINIRETKPSISKEELFPKEVVTNFAATKTETLNDTVESEWQKMMDGIKKGQEKIEKGRAYQAMEQAKKFISEHDYDQAINILKQIIEKYPGESQFHSQLGLAMQGLGWNGYAQAEFKVALYYNPKDEVALKDYLKVSQPKKAHQRSGFFNNILKH